MPRRQFATMQPRRTAPPRSADLLTVRAAAEKVIGRRRKEFTPQPLSIDSPLTDSPCFEVFATKITKDQAIIRFQADAKKGDTILVRVKKFDEAGAYVRPICYTTRMKRDLEWLNLTMVIPLTPLSRRFNVGDNLLANVVAIDPVRLELNEESSADPVEPEYFRSGRDVGCSFWKYLSRDKYHKNPYVEGHLGLPTRSTHSFLKLKGYEQDRVETASFLRRRQDKGMALEYVRKGVEEMKEGNGVMSAVPLFTKALEVFPECVEALVARGAAYANNKSLSNAESDLINALELDANAKNAKEYLTETLWHAASNLEKEGNIEEACTKLEKSLEWNKCDDRARKKLRTLGKGKRIEGERENSVEVIDDETNGDGKNSVEPQQIGDKRKSEEELKRSEEQKKDMRERVKEYEKLIASMKKNK